MLLNLNHVINPALARNAVPDIEMVVDGVDRICLRFVLNDSSTDSVFYNYNATGHLVTFLLDILQKPSLSGRLVKGWGSPDVVTLKQWCNIAADAIESVLYSFVKKRSDDVCPVRFATTDYI